MVTNEQIRRARPSVDSQLGRLIKGEINRNQYEEQVRTKSQRETEAAREPTKQAASPR